MIPRNFEVRRSDLMSLKSIEGFNKVFQYKIFYSFSNKNKICGQSKFFNFKKNKGLFLNIKIKSVLSKFERITRG